MLPPDLDPDNYDDWTDESYIESLRFNFENNPNLFFDIFSASGISPCPPLPLPHNSSNSSRKRRI